MKNLSKYGPHPPQTWRHVDEGYRVYRGRMIVKLKTLERWEKDFLSRDEAALRLKRERVRSRRKRAARRRANRRAATQ